MWNPPVGQRLIIDLFIYTREMLPTLPDTSDGHVDHTQLIGPVSTILFQVRFIIQPFHVNMKGHQWLCCLPQYPMSGFPCVIFETSILLVIPHHVV